MRLLRRREVPSINWKVGLERRGRVMEVIVRNAKQEALDSATISLTCMASKPSKLLSHVNYKDTGKLTFSIQGKIMETL